MDLTKVNVKVTVK